jgi:sodium-dependent dicarboxylate transporter 2/3/5
LLLSAGFALSAGIEKSKLLLWLGSHMRILHFVPYVLLPLVVAVIINIITEFTANAATATLFLPLLADVALSLNLHPLLLMIPATFASNFSFMLPVATPPNAIARATGYIHTTDLMIPGLLLKLFGTFLLTVLTPTLGEMLGTTTYPLSLSFLHNMCSQGFPSFLLSC